MVLGLFVSSIVVTVASAKISSADASSSRSPGEICRGTAYNFWVCGNECAPSSSSEYKSSSSNPTSRNFPLIISFGCSML